MTTGCRLPACPYLWEHLPWHRHEAAPGLGSVGACSVQQHPVLLADVVPLCSQAGRGTERGEAEASGGSEHPETQPQGAGSTQPAGYVSWLAKSAPKQAHAPPLQSSQTWLEVEHPPGAGWGGREDAACSMEKSSCWENLISGAAKDSPCDLGQFT